MGITRAQTELIIIDSDDSKHEFWENLVNNTARNITLNDGKRIDGRAYDKVRDIWGEVSVLPRAHGSAIFTRGETQALATCTLGTGDDEQIITD